MKARRAKNYLVASMGAFLLPAVSVFLLPFSRVKDSTELTSIGYITGVLFWTGILFGALFFTLAWLNVRQLKSYQELREKAHPGAVSFCKTRAGMAADICFVVSLAALIISDYIIGLPFVVTLVIMSLVLYSFCLHFLLNGRVYRYLLTKRKEEGERK